MSAHPEARHGLFDAGRELLHSLVEHLRTRLQLVGLELRREQQRLVAMAVAALLAYLLAGVTLILIALTVVAGFWDTPHRMQAMGWTLAVFVIATVVAAVVMLRRLSEPTRLFAVSLAELRKDEALLRAAPETAVDLATSPSTRSEVHAAR